MTKTIDYITKFIDSIKNITVWISGIAILILMFLNAADVVLRNLFSISISGSYEISESYLMPIITFSIFAYAYSENVLPRLDSFIIKVNENKQKVIAAFLLILEIIIFSLFVYYGLKYAISGTQSGMAFNAGGKMYPMYPIYYLVPFGFGLLTMEALLRLIKLLTYKKE